MKQLEKENYLGNIKNKFTNDQGVFIVETEYRQKVYDSWHSHQNPHITLFLKGGTIEKRKNETHAVSSGSILFYHSDEMHLNQDTLFPSKNINIEFDSAFIKKFEITEEKLKSVSANVSKTKLLILKMYNESLVSDTFSKDSISMLLSNFSESENYLNKFHQNPHWVKMLFELLNDCWNENLCLHDLAKTLNVSPITISKHFPKYFGCTYGEYMRRLKIDRAIHLIQESSISLTEIGLECGFADQSHFIRTFKQQTGFLPKIFKKL